MTSPPQECPLCLHELSKPDIIYAIKCPTSACRFNYCTNCLESFTQSASDGYQMASDGSQQLKVQVKCPQCREKYQCKTYSAGVVVSAILTMRKAAALEEIILTSNDSELRASDLSSKHAFLKEISLEELQDAVRRLQVYEREIGKATEDSTAQALDWDAWRPHVREFSGKSGSVSTAKPEAKPRKWWDPTLFCGLDELMTIEEQEFVTDLLVQGKVELLAQAAHILNGILTMAATRAVQQMSEFATSSARKGLDPATLQKLRKRYPLPVRMPRCVQMEMYDPNVMSGSPSSKPLKFDRQNNDPSTALTLVGIRGAAGRMGLRKGDIVTHVNGEAVNSLQDFMYALKIAEDDEMFWLIVNADKATAQNLKSRAEKMRADNVKFF